MNITLDSIQILFKEDLSSQSQKLFYDVNSRKIIASASHDSLDSISTYVNDWLAKNHYNSLKPAEKAQFLTNVSYINDKIEHHNRKIYSRWMPYLWNLFLRIVFLGGVGTTWYKISLDIDTKAKEIFQPKTAETRAELIQALPQLSQFQVTKKEKDAYYGFVDKTQSFIRAHTTRENLQKIVKLALERSENYTYYFQSLAHGEGIFNFKELDSDTYCHILEGLAQAELAPNNAMHYRELFYGLEKAINAKGLTPINHLIEIIKKLGKDEGDGNYFALIEKWNLSALAFPILNAIASHQNTKQLFTENSPFVQLLLKETVKAMKVPQIQENRARLPEEIQGDVQRLHDPSVYFKHFLKLNTILPKKVLENFMVGLPDEKETLKKALQNAKMTSQDVKELGWLKPTTK